MRITSLWLPFLAPLFAVLVGCSEGDSTPSGKATPESTPPDYPVTWRFALEEIEGSVQHAYALALKQSIEEVSDGRIELGATTGAENVNGFVNGHRFSVPPARGAFNRISPRLASGDSLHRTSSMRRG